KEAARQMLNRGISGLPVVDSDGRLVGIITEADFVARQLAQTEARPRLLAALLRRPEPPQDTETVGEAMTESPITISADASITEAARLMVSEKVKRLPVVDLNGDLIGVISRADIMSAFARDDAGVEDEIRSGILTRLLFHEPNAIEVSVDQGVVTLRGELPNRSDVRLLVALAGRVDGVVRVDEKLTWRYDDLTGPNFT
ncbi:MAG TPA: CBS domain-containing protein, partial [Acidimicrobiia bacterium]|nr:CBS domain-containing protein [Acidimicrobiia bacterium]